MEVRLILTASNTDNPQLPPDFVFEFGFLNIYSCGPGSSVGIVTYYEPDGPGSNPGGDEIFRPSRPALWPTQSPVKWIPGLSRG